MGKTLQEKAERKIVTVPLAAVGAGQTVDTPVFASSDATWLTSARILTATGLAASDTNYLTVSVLPYNSSGVLQAAAATANTKVTGGAPIVSNVPFVVADETISNSGLVTTPNSSPANAVARNSTVIVRVASTGTATLAAGAVAVLEFSTAPSMRNVPVI
jgi:hypothetical protein